MNLSVAQSAIRALSTRQNMKLFSSQPINDVLEDFLPLSQSPTREDIICIETRQLDNSAPGIFAVEKQRCRYGKPRAFVR